MPDLFLEQVNFWPGMGKGCMVMILRNVVLAVQNDVTESV